MSTGLFAQNSATDDFVKTVGWNGQNSLHFVLGGQKVWIDPIVAEAGVPQPDIVLLTHAHQDHFQPAVLKKIAADQTVFYAPADVLAELKKTLPEAKTVTVEPGLSFKAGSLSIQAVPAYNVVKTNRHPQGNKWVGYVLSDGKIRVYDTGDTERIPEMASIKADVIFLPLGQTYTMNSVEEAVEAASDVKAALAIPVHYGMYEGTQADAEKFVQLAGLRKIKTLLLKRSSN